MTTQEALAKWDKGETLQGVSFHKDLDQQIYAAAFEIIRLALNDPTRPIPVGEAIEDGSEEETTWFRDVLYPKALKLPQLIELETGSKLGMIGVFAAFNTAGILTRLGWDEAMKVAPADRIIEVRKAVVH